MEQRKTYGLTTNVLIDDISLMQHKKDIFLENRMKLRPLHQVYTASNYYTFSSLIHKGKERRELKKKIKTIIMLPSVVSE